MPIGGLRRIDARSLDLLHVEAPVDGYVDRVQWKYIAQKTQDSTIGNKALFWLKIGPDFLPAEP